MSQSKTNGGGFFAKIKDNYSSKFSGLSLSSNTEKDGNSEDDTLIHNAFVKYFNTKGERYPDWLGVKEQQAPQGQRHQSQSSQYHPQNSQYQPQNSQHQPQNSQYQPQNPHHEPRNFDQQRSYSQPQVQQVSQSQRPAYQPRSNSRLQDMYNKSRQQSVPGSGYNSQPASRPSEPGRSQSFSTGTRLRERMLNNSPTMTQTGSHSNSPTPPPSQNSTKATWGRK